MLVLVGELRQLAHANEHSHQGCSPPDGFLCSVFTNVSFELMSVNGKEEVPTLASQSYKLNFSASGFIYLAFLARKHSFRTVAERRFSEASCFSACAAIHHFGYWYL